MLAALGFSIAGIFFVIFSLTVRSLAPKKLTKVFEKYSLAYQLLAVAFLIWATVSVIDSSELLALSVVVGDFLLLIATLLIFDVQLGKNKNKTMLLFAGGFVGLVLLLVRTIFFYPKPYMTEDILFFNSQRLVSFSITAVFLLIWLPVNLYIASQVTAKTQSLSRLYSLLYATATLSAVIFLLAKTPLAVTLSFTAITASFLGLILSNTYITALKEAKNGR